jgi:hypothetical protein
MLVSPLRFLIDRQFHDAPFTIAGFVESEPIRDIFLLDLFFGASLVFFVFNTVKGSLFDNNGPGVSDVEAQYLIAEDYNGHHCRSAEFCIDIALK